jgi:ribose transport system permease protein
MDSYTEAVQSCQDPEPQSRTAYNQTLKRILRDMGTALALVFLVIVAAIISPYFLKPSNLINVLRQIAITGIVSIGMTFVILTGGIDLSVGSIVGVVAVVGALLLQQGSSLFSVAAACLAVGLLIGGINGVGISLGKMPPFIMTLGMMVSARGVAMTLSNGQPISWRVSGIDFSFLGGGALLGLPVPVVIYAAILAMSFIMLTKLPFGRYFYAIGDSREAARLSGVNVKFTEISAYVINGLLCGLAGLIWISRLGVGEPSAGTALELDAIAMVVIGGTSINGGKGSVIGTFIGASILMVIANILNLVGVTPFTQQIIRGLIIICAVLFDQVGKSK